MGGMHYASYFFGGAFLTNALPHFVSGVMGRPFQTPFAKPPGRGLSSSSVNALWGFFNLVIAYILLCQIGNLDMHATAQVLALGAGVLLSALVMAHRFGRFHGGNSPEDA